MLDQLVPPLREGQIWQCRHQGYSAKVISRTTPGVFVIGVRTTGAPVYDVDPRYLVGRELLDGSGWGWTDRAYSSSFELTNLLFDPGMLR